MFRRFESNAHPSVPLRRTGIACEVRPQGTYGYSMRPQGRLQTEYRFVPDYKPTDNWLCQGQSQENDVCSNNLLRNTDSSTFHSILLTINGQRDPETKENQLHMILQAHYQSMIDPWPSNSPSHLNTAVEKLKKLLSIEEAKPSKHLSDQNQHRCGYGDKQ